MSLDAWLLTSSFSLRAQSGRDERHKVLDSAILHRSIVSMKRNRYLSIGSVSTRRMVALTTSTMARCAASLIKILVAKKERKRKLDEIRAKQTSDGRLATQSARHDALRQRFAALERVVLAFGALLGALPRLLLARFEQLQLFLLDVARLPDRPKLGRHDAIQLQVRVQLVQRDDGGAVLGKEVVCAPHDTTNARHGFARAHVCVCVCARLATLTGLRRVLHDVDEALVRLGALVAKRDAKAKLVGLFALQLCIQRSRVLVLLTPFVLRAPRSDVSNAIDRERRARRGHANQQFGRRFSGPLLPRRFRRRRRGWHGSGSGSGARFALAARR